jgi:hypothetical protein
LTTLNLVERDDGTIYRVTKLGKAVYIAITLIEDALVIKGRLDIIDSLDAHRETPTAERRTIIERLIDNKNIKSILTKKRFSIDIAKHRFNMMWFFDSEY